MISDLVLSLLVLLFQKSFAILILLDFQQKDTYHCHRNNPVLNFQGTGSAGATVRIYIEQFEPDVSKHEMDAQTALKPLIGQFTFILRKLLW